MDTVILQSCEGQKFRVARDAAFKSGFLRDMLQALPETDVEGEEDVIPIPGVSSFTLKKVSLLTFSMWNLMQKVS